MKVLKRFLFRRRTVLKEFYGLKTFQKGHYGWNNLKRNGTVNDFKCMEGPPKILPFMKVLKKAWKAPRFMKVLKRPFCDWKMAILGWKILMRDDWKGLIRRKNLLKSFYGWKIFQRNEIIKGFKWPDGPSKVPLFMKVLKKAWKGLQRSFNSWKSLKGSVIDKILLWVSGAAIKRISTDEYHSKPSRGRFKFKRTLRNLLWIEDI